MITELEFKNALKIIVSYKLQVEKDLNQRAIVNRRTINILNDIPNYTFRVLCSYYLEEYEIVLKKEDLKAMDVRLLKLIDYDKLNNIKSLGVVRLYNFKKLLVLHLVLDKEVLIGMKKQF